MDGEGHHEDDLVHSPPSSKFPSVERPREQRCCKWGENVAGSPALGEHGGHRALSPAVQPWCAVCSQAGSQPLCSVKAPPHPLPRGGGPPPELFTDWLSLAGCSPFPSAHFPQKVLGSNFTSDIDSLWDLEEVNLNFSKLLSPHLQSRPNKNGYLIRLRNTAQLTGTFSGLRPVLF